MSDREMFRMAKSDLKIIELIFAKNNIEDSMINQAASHVKMAVEKMCKYASSMDGSGYPDTHNINELFRNLEKNDIYYPKMLKEIGSVLNTWGSAGPYSEIGMTTKRELNTIIDIIESWVLRLDA